MVGVITEDTATITAQNNFAEVSYVPPGAKCAIGLSGITDSTVTLEAKWNQTGSFVIQKTFTADPTEAEHFTAPRACTLRLGVATGNYGTDTVVADIGFDYPIGL